MPNINFLIPILLSLFVSAAIVCIALPKIVLLSLRKKLIDPINSRKIHQTVASRLGGVIFFPAIFLSSAFTLSVTSIFFNISFGGGPSLYLEFSALLIIFMIGLADDLLGVSYRIKFAAQVICALIVIMSGTNILAIHLTATSIILPFWLSIPLTILLIVFIINAINLIDGINGLASMLAILALFIYGCVFLLYQNYLHATLSFVTLGALLPFWYHNVFGVRKRTQARVFMGDSGSLVIGFILSMLAIKVWNIDSGNTYITCNMCHVLAYTMLIVPCFDVLMVIILRAKAKKPLFKPDNNHIHHRIMSCNLSQKQALLTIIIIQLLYLVVNMFLIFFINIFFIIVIDLIIWMLLHYWLCNVRRRVNAAKS